MGSLTSRPKAPSAPQTVYVPTVQYIPAPITAPASNPAPAPAETSVPSTTTDAPTPQAARQANLLERSRGVLSTVLTGFRGVLGNTTSASNRKTLLGE